MEATFLKHNFEFGKIDYNNSGRKNCPTVVELELRTRHNSMLDKPYIELSICGGVYNPRRTDYYTCGQCLDTLKEYIGTNPVFNKLYKWWKSYHLNGMHAGTEEQEKALENCPSHDYKERCEYLKSVNLYEVEYNGKPYKYGHSWLMREIPTEVIEEIKTLCEADK